MKPRTLLAGLVAAASIAFAGPSAAQTNLEFWHSMDGALGDAINDLATRFNTSQKEYRVVPVYKGSYDETVALALAASVQGKAPNIVQVYDVGTGQMAAARKAVKPLHQLMRETGEKLNSNAFAPAVASYYSDSKGNLLSLPFNVSTPVFYINKDAFTKAGLDPEAPLKTWYDVQAALLKIQEVRATPCGLTTTWPSWVLVENTLSRHNEQFATRNNGFEGLDAQLTFNTRLAIRHISLLTSWIKSEIFTYSGRRGDAEKLFAKGECAMLTSSSASYAGILRDAGFRFGVKPMPGYDDLSAMDQNSTMGGASLWAMAGKSAKENRGVAKFFEFLARPEIQADWHQATGYLPLNSAAYEITRGKGFYDRFPGTDVPVREIASKGVPPAFSRGVRLGSHAQVRAILDEELEAVFAQRKPPKQGLDDAVTRGNELLRRFERSHQM